MSSGDDLEGAIFADMLISRSLPPEMVRDLLAIAQLDARAVERIRSVLSSFQALASERIDEAIGKCLPASDEDTSRSIVRTLLNVPTDDIEILLRTVERWRQGSEERRQIFTDETLANFDRNLRALVSDYQSLALIRKANRLLRSVGNEFENIAYFCDMRPVFDEPRENIEGFVMLANMKIIYMSQDGERHALELALTEDELREIIKMSEKAMKKIAVLKEVRPKLARSTESEGGR